MRDIQFTTPDSGWAVGGLSGEARILQTTNGGIVRESYWVSPGSGVPGQFILAQNYPNPFNAGTDFRLQITDYGLVSLTIFDLLGHEVATIVNEKLPSGTYTRQWDAAGLPSGVYFYRLKAGGFGETKKLILLK